LYLSAIYLCNFLEKPKLEVFFLYAISGILPGFLLGGNTSLGIGKTGTLIGSIICFILYGLLAVTFINRQKEKKRYLSFRGEPLFYTVLSFTGVWIGILLSSILTNFFYTHDQYLLLQGVIKVSIPLILSLLFAISFGFALAANLKRPILGTILTLFSSVLVLWIGIDIAPMLFLPGSGLLWAGLIIGSLLLIMSRMAMALPQMHVFIGSVIVILSILSYVGAIGGLIIGVIFGIIGGSLIIAWQGEKKEATMKEMDSNKKKELTNGHSSSILYVHQKMIAATQEEK
jgi:MFS family permease